jgi:hypothetical protein
LGADVDRTSLKVHAPSTRSRVARLAVPMAYMWLAVGAAVVLIARRR